MCVVSGSLALAHGGICTIFDLGCAGKPLKQSLIQSRCIATSVQYTTVFFMHYIFGISNLFEVQHLCFESIEVRFTKLRVFMLAGFMFTPPPVAEQSIVMSVSGYLSVCLSESISEEPHVKPSPNFLCILPVTMARSSSGMLQYVMYFHLYR